MKKYFIILFTVLCVQSYSQQHVETTNTTGLFFEVVAHESITNDPNPINCSGSYTHAFFMYNMMSKVDVQVYIGGSPTPTVIALGSTGGFYTITIGGITRNIVVTYPAPGNFFVDIY